MIKIILTVIFFVGSLGGGLYVVHPLYEDYQVRMEENEVLKEELENIRVYIAELREIERKIEEHEEEFEFIASALPEDHDAPTLFLYLQNQMDAHNLTSTSDFGDFSVDPYVIEESEHERVKEVSFSLALEGDYENIKNFFGEIEQVARVMSIEGVNFSSSEGPAGFGEETPAGAVGLNVEMSAFSY